MEINQVEWLVSQIETHHLKVCNNYPEFYCVCAAFATDMRESGREYARRICKVSDNYQKRYREEDKDFNVQYSACLKNNNGRLHIASVFQLAKDAGLDLKGCPRSSRDTCDSVTPNTVFRACASRYEKKSNNPNSNPKNYTMNNYKAAKAAPAIDADEEVILEEGSTPDIPMPTLIRDSDISQMPYILKEILGLQTKTPQKDVTFLSSNLFLIYPVSHISYFIYDGHKYFPTPFFIVQGSPASGKGCLSETKALLDYLEERKYKEYQRALEEYKRQKQAYADMGKNRSETLAPEMPKYNMVFVSPNATDSANIQAINDCEGHCVIFASEISDLVASNEREQGGLQYGSTFRQLFDNADISLVRRTNNEHILIKEPKVLAMASGTPVPAKRLIVSAENGQFSRCLYYFMPDERKFENRFSRKEDVAALIKELGKEWTLMVEKRMEGVSEIKFLLTPQQENDMYLTFSILNDRSLNISNDMTPFVRRLIINIQRLMHCYAFIRAMEDWNSEKCLLKPHPSTNSDNLKDGIISRYQLWISDADFYFLLSMSSAMFEHASHAYSLLDEKSVNSKRMRERELLLSKMPAEFSCELYYATGRSMGFGEERMRKWLSRDKAKGIIESLGNNFYRKK
ncbi:MAG: DUF3987 domain-containing protein [Bacteroidales bacterium]|nr:DUF3987 domain-containing protein [Bacteroidales bacterium]